MPKQPEFLSAIQISHILENGLQAGSVGVVLPPQYRFERQEKTNWCWAAISAFIANVWVKEDLSQSAIASRLGEQDNNNPIKLTSALEVVLSFADRTNLGYTRITNISEAENYVRDALSNYQCPIPVAVDWNVNDPHDTAHFVCIFGAADDFSLYEIYDPWKSRPEQDLTIVRPLSYLDAYNEDGGLGKATHFYRWIAA